MNEPDELPGGLFGLVVDRPIATLMVFIAAAVFGLVSYNQLPLNLMPDLSFPTLTVRTEYPGAAPEEVEAQVSLLLEDALSTSDGLVSIQSRSRADSSDVVLEFDWGTEMSAATQSVRERLQTTWLNENVGRPLILRYDPSMDPILRVALSTDPGDPKAPSGNAALFLLRELADDEVKRELETLDGVAAVRVRGGLERQVLVELREDWLGARGVTLAEVRQAIVSENVNLAGGSIREGDTEFLLRTLNEFVTLDEVRELLVLRSDGQAIPLRELAEVRETFKDRLVISHLDGREAVELEIFKEADANIVTVANRVKAFLGESAKAEAEPEPEEAKAERKQGKKGRKGGRGRGGGARAPGGGGGGGPPQVDTLASKLPSGVVLQVLDDQALFIESAVDNLRSTAVLGGVLAVLILFLFLRDLRATAIIGTAIPISVVCTFAPMYLGGVSLNLMSLGGLALGVGMLVDNAVVVLEAIQVYRERGDSRRDAALSGVREVAAAVTASTLTTVAVFLPIVFVEGVAGQIFGDLAMAVVFSLLASLVVALLFVPMLAARELGIGDSQGFGELSTLTAGLPSHLGAELRPEGEGARDSARQLPGRVAQGAKASPGVAKRWGRGLPAVTELVASWRSFRSPDDGEGLLGRLWRWLCLPYALLRFLVRLPFELMGTLILTAGVAFLRVLFAVGGVVLPPLHRLALGGAAVFQSVYGGLSDRYPRVLSVALARPGTVLGFALLALIATGAALDRAGQELIPEVHQGRFTAELALPVGTPIDRTVVVVGQAEALMLAHPEVDTVYTAVGTEGRADSRPDEGEHSARVLVQLTPGGDLTRREARVMEELRQQLADFKGLETTMVAPALFTFRTPVELVVTGQDLDMLRELSQQVVGRLERVDGLQDVRSSLVDGYPEVRIRYDRRLLERFGLNTSGVAQALRDKIQGADASRMARGDKRVDMVVRLAERDRESVSDLESVNVNPRLNPPIPLSSVATLTQATGPSEIRRVDQQRAAVISASPEELDLASIGERVQGALDGVQFPPGTEYTLAGQAQEMQRSLRSLSFALLLAVFLVYVIMASTFESLVHPFVILFAVPLAAVGVAPALLVTDTSMSVVVFIGLIVLAGMVVNNAIVLVDRVNRNRAEGMSVNEALSEGARARLRPILITTSTTVLGLLPLSLGLGAGSEIQQPLALTVIAGLLSSTLLTLLVVPVAYRLVASLVARLRPAAAE